MAIFLKLLIFFSVLGHLFAILPPAEVEVISFEEENGLMIDKGKVYEFTSEFSEKGPTITDVTKFVTFFRKDAYWLFRKDGRETFLLPGDDFIQIFDKPSEQDFKERYVSNYGVRGKNSDDIQPPSDINIKAITTKTSLTEKIYGRTFDYKPTWLLRKFYKACSCHHFQYDELVPPWVEAESDFGSTEEIKITFKKPTKGITVLNGYVDIFRPHLYGQNNRLRLITVSAKEFDIQFEFQDIPRFTSIRFPSKTSQVTIKILSVYSGSKYNDTAISAIIGYIPPKETKATLMKSYKIK